MSIPWRFIIALPLGLLLGIATFIVFLDTQLGVPTHQSQWISDISQKKERLASQIPGPKLLIVAGSSGLFSINAQLIEQETHYSTINMATHAGLSLDYRLYRIEKVARPGDTVLLACEYEFFEDGFGEYSEINDDYILARDPEYFRRMSLLDTIHMATRIEFKRLQLGWRNRRHAEKLRPPSIPYSPYTPITPGIDCLDENGDEVFNLTATRPPPSAPALERPIPILVNGLPSDNTSGFRTLAAFLDWAKAHQITVLASFPAAVRQGAYNSSTARQAIETITHFYTAHGVPVIGSADEVMLPADQFYDTMYHLTHEAALQRTEHLIPELAPYLHPNS